MKNALSIAASLAALMGSRASHSHFGGPSLRHDPPASKTAPVAQRPKRIRYQPRSEAQTILHQMTGWQLHQWEKAGRPQSLAKIRQFAAMRMGEAA